MTDQTTPEGKPERLYSAGEAARMIGCTTETARRMVSDGRLQGGRDPHTPHGPIKIPASALLKWQRALQPPPPVVRARARPKAATPNRKETP